MAETSSTRYDLLTWLILAVTAFGLLVYIVFVPHAADESAGKANPSVGKPLGRVRFQPLTGATATLTADDLYGKVVLIDYWGPNCPPCKRELPELIAAVEQFQNRSDFMFVPISCPLGDEDEELANLKSDTESFMSHIRSTAATYQLPEEILKQTNTPAMGEMYIAVMPTTVVIDRKGIIRGKWQGYVDGYERQVADLIAELLGDNK